MATEQQPPTEFEKFHGALKKIVSTPKAEIEKREVEWQRERSKKRKHRLKEAK